MAEITAFSDPTDWKGSSLQPLEHLDVALRCEVCKEFYNAPMITACCHTFCSLCIRRALDRDKRCPICRTESQEYTLRKNTAVQDLLEAFTGCRQQLLEFATKEKVPGRKVEEVVEAGDKDIMMSSQGSQRSQRSQRQSQSQRQRKFVGEYSEDGDGDYIGSLSPPPDDGRVPCPVCPQRIKEALINSHLDQCLTNKQKPTPTLSSSEPLAPANRPARTTQIRSSTTAAAKDIKPLPKITYNFLSDKKLRVKLRELGIPDHGNKKLLQERHTEWTYLHNANCDAHPSQQKTKKELLKELATWEMAHVKPANDKSKAPEWSAKAWSTNHDGEFQSLIEKARDSGKRRKVEREEETDKGETGDGDHQSLPVNTLENPPSSEPFDGTSTADWPPIINAQPNRYDAHQMASTGPTPMFQPSIQLLPISPPSSSQLMEGKRKYSGIK